MRCYAIVITIALVGLCSSCTNSDKNQKIQSATTVTTSDRLQVQIDSSLLVQHSDLEMWDTIYTGNHLSFTMKRDGSQEIVWSLKSGKQFCYKTRYHPYYSVLSSGLLLYSNGSIISRTNFVGINDSKFAIARKEPDFKLRVIVEPLRLDTINGIHPLLIEYGREQISAEMSLALYNIDRQQFITHSGMHAEDFPRDTISFQDMHVYSVESDSLGELTTYHITTEMFDFPLDEVDLYKAFMARWHPSQRNGRVHLQ
jgi:hypothetical protein